ncbi:MAG: ATP-dependent helicase HrpB, partial [Kiritimatiellae bacterium]|nr:ATP-dependent helicase HrpB [Kiritimatiellia bacterium]
LNALGATDGAGRVTPLGRIMAALGIHPRLSAMVVKAADAGREAFDEACVLAAALSENLPSSSRPSSNAEHLVRDVVDGGGAIPQPVRARIRELSRAIASACLRRTGPAPQPSGGSVETGALLALAYPDRIARRRALARSEGRYLLIGGRGAKIQPGDALAHHDWIVVADMDDADADGSVRLAAPISAQTVERLFSDRFEQRRVFGWNSRLEKVEAAEKTFFGAVVVREKPLSSPDPEAMLAALCDGIRSCGVSRLGWIRGASRLRDRIAFARKAAPEAGFPDVSDEALGRSLESWLGPALFGLSSLAQAEKVDVESALRDSLGALAPKLDALFPAAITVPTGSRIALDYSGETPAAQVRLQECFGMTQTPRIAAGRIGVVLRLLSPAMRPVQTTADIASFWREGYPLVRKELRGRYPRHFWPEDPVSAPPTRRTKRP